ncbi:unnamed protein product, partial [Ilex paraguariensis]
MYNPHRFARHHGFHQKLSGTPLHPSIISFDASFLYRAWLSLTRINSGAGFHVLNNYARIENRYDNSYNNWWKYDVLPHLDDINCKTLLASESENFKFKAQANGSGKGKSLPIVAKTPSRLRKWDTSKNCLNSQEQLAPKMLKVTTPISRSANVRFVHPLNFPESAEVIQERCQTRAIEAEHNLACTRIEDGANHTTIKSLTGRVDPSCDALNNLSTFLELSPRSRNKAFPPLPDLATLYSIVGICEDQNLDNDIIGALFDDNDRTISILSDS